MAADEVDREPTSDTSMADAAVREPASDTSVPIRMELDHEPAVALPANSDEHMSILQTFIELQRSAHARRQGAAGQAPLRALEQAVRRRVVMLAQRWSEWGLSLSAGARRLAIPERTVRHWIETYRPAPPPVAPCLGRPLQQADAAQRQTVRSCLDQVGPGIGVPSLRLRFAELARAELDALLKDYRRQWRCAHPRLVHVLHWQVPGSVWAMDFAEAPCVIDGFGRYLLAVRDLASGRQLLWQPVAAPTANAVMAELPWLFALHGAPWVLKTDNGSAFIAEALRWYLGRVGVLQLFSPPYTPAYNGSIEASIGSLKIRTEKHATLSGHPGQWTAADLAYAQREANETARPRRLRGKTPEEVWQAHEALSPDAQASFRATVESCRREARHEGGIAEEEMLGRQEEAAIDRVAIRRALVAHDLLLFRRRRVPPRITRPKTAIEW